MTPILTGTVRECERCRAKVATHEFETLAASEEMIRQHPYLSKGVHWFCDDCIGIVVGEGVPED